MPKSPEQLRYTEDEALEEASEMKEKVEHKEAKDYEEAEEGKTPEAKETKKLPPVFLIYRNNNVFEKLVPKIAETFGSLDREVKIQSFPAGTDQIKILNWILTNSKEIAGTEIVTDETVKYAFSGIEDEMRHFPDPNEEAAKEKAMKVLKNCSRHYEYLDFFEPPLIGETLFGKNYSDEFHEKAESLEKSGELISDIVKRIIINKDNIPQKVYISRQEIFAHQPLRQIPENPRYESEEELMKGIEIVKEWLIKGGIPKEAFVEGEFEHNLSWVIMDRHSRSYPQGDKIKIISGQKEITLGLPLSNFFQDACKTGLITLTPEEKQRYNKLLKEKLIKL
ncbi:hypothetical protein KKD20_00365 [Patescibacteria group bacterium]|nr:hypothetical protein [Patescibacteria group bacterium]